MGWHGAAEQVSLALGTANGTQVLELGLVLDAFGNHIHVERTRKHQTAGQYCVAARIVLHGLNE